MLDVLLACVLTCLCGVAHAQGFTADARASRFVTAVVLNDFHTAQAGGGYVFSYGRDDTDSTLAARLDRWFTGRDPHATGMGADERQTLYAFYWAAAMMPANSPCFTAMANDACRAELSKWIARESGDDPRFVDAYELARGPLGLPPLRRRAE
jgi:hypothetical protein